MQIYAVDPFRYEAIVLMADKNFGGVTVHTVVFRQFYCSTECLRFAWESCGNAAMGVLDFPCAIVAHHDISRFMQLFPPTHVFPHSSEDNALARLPVLQLLNGWRVKSRIVGAQPKSGPTGAGSLLVGNPDRGVVVVLETECAFEPVG